jgi:hypothetical protein
MDKSSNIALKLAEFGIACYVLVVACGALAHTVPAAIHSVVHPPMGR